MYDHILIRYGELSLKKGNRKTFTNRLNNHIKRALSSFEKIRFEDRGVRYYVHLNGTEPDEIIEILRKIPGIYSFSLVAKTNSNIDDIKNLAEQVLKSEIKGNTKIKIETNRADKNFPLKSPEITKEVARHIFKNIENIKADMHEPDLTMNIDVRPEGTFIYTKVYKGLGGFPSGILGKGLLLISGGLDSVVGGYLALKKGIELEAIHFASPPHTSAQAEQKVIDLIEKIACYDSNQKITLHVIPFTKIQEQIYRNCQDDYGITIMRRMMYRIAERLAKSVNAVTLVTGESVGQVASQTLESLAVINEVTNIPIVRPLSTMDKEDIIKIARDIETYDISIKPYEDCCTIFVPRHPQIKPKLSKAIEEENKFDYESLIEEALINKKVYHLSSKKHTNIFINDENIENLF